MLPIRFRARISFVSHVFSIVIHALFSSVRAHAYTYLYAYQSEIYEGIDLGILMRVDMADALDRVHTRMGSRLLPRRVIGLFLFTKPIVTTFSRFLIYFILLHLFIQRLYFLCCVRSHFTGDLLRETLARVRFLRRESRFYQSESFATVSI